MYICVFLRLVGGSFRACWRNYTCPGTEHEWSREVWHKRVKLC